MTKIQKAFFFIFLPVIALLCYPPETLMGGLPVISVIAILFILLGIAEWRGSALALTFAIFVQGFNVIVRIMMFFTFSFTKAGVLEVTNLIARAIGIILSMYLLLRLDQTDIRLTMVK